MGRVVREEEERFEKTLDKGLALLEDELASLEEQAQQQISGIVAFKLYDTYGFPLDIINDVSEKRGIAVDEDGFRELMNKQKERAKAAWKGSGETDIAARFAALLEEGLRSSFTGYDSLHEKSRIIALLNSEGERVGSLSAKAGEASGFCVTGSTPFYGASGGQAGDTGTLFFAHGKADITDTLRPSPELTVHQITVTEGEILLDAEVTLEVAEGPRLASARNHSCTHLLHAALLQVLGSHARQAGSLVSPDRLRFDFNHVSAMTREELAQVERRVNAAIMADRPITARDCSYGQAIADGAVALFNEKYADTVRVVYIENESTELCGGTHLARTGQAGAFVILSESGVAAGVRRIEAATGWNALAEFTSRRTELEEAWPLLKSRPGELPGRIHALQEEARALRKQLEKTAAKAASGNGKDLMDSVEEIGGVRVLAVRTAASNIKALREIADDLRSKMPSGVIALTAEDEEGKVSMIVAVTRDLHNRFTAPALIKEAAAAIGGSGGGRSDMAQAGGNNPAGIDEAFAILKKQM